MGGYRSLSLLRIGFNYWNGVVCCDLFDVPVCNKVICVTLMWKFASFVWVFIYVIFIVVHLKTVFFGLYISSAT